MGFFAGSHRTGLLAILTALLLPAFGLGVAHAQEPYFEVGDTIDLLIPDLSEFPADPMNMGFTCRAVTDNAYWLVQDSVSCDKKGGAYHTDSLAWGVTIDQAELDILTSYFEAYGDDYDVWGTVTGEMGVPIDTDGDPRIWIVLATVPTKYNSSQTSQSARNNMNYVNPEDLAGGFNGHDIFYLNIHTFATAGVTLPKARVMRQFYLANGLAELSRMSRQPLEDQWVVRGLGGVAQYLCYGFTSFAPTSDLSHQYICSEFAKAPSLDLSNHLASNARGDWAASRAQSFLFMMYLRQREGEGIIGEIALSDTTGMLNVARAIDSSIPDSLAVQTNVVPIYNDWLVCNLVSAYGDDMSEGIYTYDFLEGNPYQFGHLGQTAAFLNTFGAYPITDIWIADDVLAMPAPIWSSQYLMFVGDYSAYPTVHFNGQYSDGSGSGPAIEGKWYAWVVAVDATLGEIVSVTAADLDDFYHGTFELDGEQSYLIVTNNNEGGALDGRYVISQDEDLPDVLISAFQNSINDQHLTLYTTLYEIGSEGFDWYGPLFSATVGDSAAVFPMSSFYSTLWSNQFSAWVAGSYELDVSGFDSTGLAVNNSITVAVDWAASTGIHLDVDGIYLDIPAGSVAPGAMVTMCEADMLGLSLASQSPLETAGAQMTGIVSGPVSIPNVNGTISFPAETAEGAVYRYTDGAWQQLDSWLQAGRMSASVSDGGIYVFGQAPGVASPEVPAEFRVGGAFPNPFSSEAAIRFSLPTAGHVSAMVFDMSGRIVTILSDEDMQAAEHTLVWDGTDSTGNPVAAGVYFCRLQAAGQTVTQKMLRIE